MLNYHPLINLPREISPQLIVVIDTEEEFNWFTDKPDRNAISITAMEKIVVNFIPHWVKKTGITKIALSGGVTANVKLNQHIFEIDEVNEIFIYPNMGDGGCGTGAALYHCHSDQINPAISNSYFSPDYSNKEMQQELDSKNLNYTQIDNLAIEVAQWLNKRQGRTEFIPFAPVTLYETREKYFININGAEHAAEFITITFDCTDAMKRDCPAAVHVDGTARPQLIRHEVNLGYYNILKEHKNLSGIFCFINTSFNMHKEPIVCTPFDAIRAYLQGNLDYLAIGPFLIKHPEASRK